VKIDLPVPQVSGGSFKTLIKKNVDTPGEVLTEEDMRLREKANIEAALNQTGWRKSTALAARPNSSASNPPPSSPVSKKWGLRRPIRFGSLTWISVGMGYKSNRLL
jgi:hypothetical protein